MHDFYKGSRSDSWRTPDTIFKRLESQYKFVCDLAASEENTKCEKFFSEENSALGQEWPEGILWLNPPYSRAKPFFDELVKKEAKAVCIYKSANMETATWQSVILPKADWVLVLNKRVSFIEPQGKTSTGPTFGSSLIGFGVEPPEDNKQLGFLLDLKKLRS